jgi:hypothetical protein
MLSDAAQGGDSSRLYAVYRELSTSEELENCEVRSRPPGCPGRGPGQDRRTAQPGVLRPRLDLIDVEPVHGGAVLTEVRPLTGAEACEHRRPPAAACQPRLRKSL